MTPLGERLLRQIAATGPITVADYMAQCLSDPEHGYYATRDPLGAAGDFTTAPEISQMFGELIGIALAQAWIDQGAPERIVLAELGPGRGTLMADALRATRSVAAFQSALSVHFVETSPVLRAAQAQAVPGATFHDSVADLPEAPLFLIANEFFDALPIRQFVRDPGGWRERVVGAADGALVFGLTDPAPVAALDHRLEDTPEGGLVELCPALPAIAEEIGRRIAFHRGAAIIVDYGDWTSQGDTLQAVRAHEPIDPLVTPGEADLTAHVDFAALAAAVAPARASRLSTQGVFLERLGITHRARALAKAAGPDGAEAIALAHRRLTHPSEMGDHFKVMSITANDCPPPPGLVR